MVLGAVTPMMSSKIAGAFGVPEAAVSKIVSLGIPVILASLLKRGSTSGGMDAIGAAMNGLGKSPLDGLGASLGGSSTQVAAAAQGGSDMLGSLLGVGTVSTISKALSSYAGVDAASVGPLLGLAGSATLGSLKTTADEQGLNAAGLMRMLETQKDKIGSEIPPEFARLLDTAGVLPAAATVKKLAAPAQPLPQPAGGYMKWIIGAVVVGGLVWLGTSFLGRDTVVPAATETATVNPLIVDGVNIGDSVQGILSNLTATLAGVKDAATAQAALEPLTDTESALEGLQTAVSGLSSEGKSSVAKLINAALPPLKSSIDALLAESTIGPILKPVLDRMTARLTTFAG